MPEFLNYDITPRAFAMRCTPEELYELQNILQENAFQSRILEYRHMKPSLNPGETYRFDFPKVEEDE